MHKRAHTDTHQTLPILCVCVRVCMLSASTQKTHLFNLGYGLPGAYERVRGFTLRGAPHTHTAQRAVRDLC